ncbi:MAG: LLM class flavin-dependent oxidoreductase [Deltaproteobacteria bacterium]|nr:LLM class flavin-dependent oxidoreductase [Deltaproteobacteria bacterium]
MRAQLSVVDQAPVRKGGSAAEALREALALAERCDALGYARYWVAEHHSLPGIASTSPEILIGQIAARTRAIRVGSGGVMLMHYSALKVAENFRMLESLFPGRIDCGLGRAPGSDQRTAAALAYPGQLRSVHHYPEQLDDLAAFLTDEMPAGHPFRGIQASPTRDGVPELWLLGSGIDSALMAAERGLPFSFAHFFGAHAGGGPKIVAAYRDRFRPSRWLAAPRVHVGVMTICAESEERARYHAASLRLSRLNLARGVNTGLASPEEALAYPYSQAELDYLEKAAMPAVVGDPGQVLAGLERVAADYAADELGIVTFCFDFAARVRSYELIAEAARLAPRG